MTERHLHAVPIFDPDTGEIEDPLETQNKMLQREINGYRLRLAAKEQELARVQGVDPNAEEVKAVLDYWAKRVLEDGWWRTQPKYRPGDQRWSAVSARLKDGRGVDDCQRAVEGALCQGKKGVRREWVDALSIFRNNENFERHLERQLDPKLNRVVALKLLPEALQRWADLDFMAERCECSHCRIEHSVLRWEGAPMDGWSPCMAHGCACCDFDLAVAA